MPRTRSVKTKKKKCVFKNNGTCIVCGVKKNSKQAKVCTLTKIVYRREVHPDKWKSLPFNPSFLLEGIAYYHCFFCKKILDQEQVTIEHLIPKSKGGTDDKNNRKPACRECNIEKGNKMWYEYIALRIFDQRVNSRNTMISEIVKIINRNREIVCSSLEKSPEVITLVQLELSKIKKNATSIEWNRLIQAAENFQIFGNSLTNCVYGTLAGDCFNSRAVVLIKECADVICYNEKDESYRDNKSIYKFLPNNGRLKKSDITTGNILDLRTIPTIVTPLELFILSEEPDTENIEERIWYPEDYPKTNYIIKLIKRLNDGRSIIGYNYAELSSESTT